MVARAVVGDTVRVAGTLESGREAWAHRRWGAAVAALGAADGAAPLAIDDLERLAIALFLTGAEGDSTEAWARAYHACIAEDDVARAARCAFWLGFALDITGTDAPPPGGTSAPGGWSSTPGSTASNGATSRSPGRWPR